MDASDLSRTPLADVTPKNSQVTPTGLASLSQQFSRAGSATALTTPACALTAPGSALVTPAVVARENVEEQCLSADRWLRGLAEECVDNMYTPAKPQPATDAESQVLP